MPSWVHPLAVCSAVYCSLSHIDICLCWNNGTPVMSNPCESTCHHIWYGVNMLHRVASTFCVCHDAVGDVWRRPGEVRYVWGCRCRICRKQHIQPDWLHLSDLLDAVCRFDNLSSFWYIDNGRTSCFEMDEIVYLFWQTCYAPLPRNSIFDIYPLHHTS